MPSRQTQSESQRLNSTAASPPTSRSDAQVLANIETAQRQNKLFAALKQGNSALADLRRELPLEDVEKLMAESAEHKEYEDRMRDLLGESLTPEDDAAALDELARLEEEENAQAAQELPDVPTVGLGFRFPLLRKMWEFRRQTCLPLAFYRRVSTTRAQGEGISLDFWFWGLLMACFWRMVTGLHCTRVPIGHAHV